MSTNRLSTIESRTAALPSVLFAVLAAAMLAGCATPPPGRQARPFEFQHDTFAFGNELVWEYSYDADGKWTHGRREPIPDYTHHCFIVARAAKQFFEHARFDAALPKADEATYQRLIRQVVGRSPRARGSEERKIVIPGYADLFSFSAAHEALLKTGCGGAWESYFQRGHWRMLLPFSRSGQESVARRLVESLRENRPAVLHLVRFPQLYINHAVVTFGFIETEQGVTFAIYDPNKPDQPTTLSFERASRTFRLPSNDYFRGGRVDVYEIYRRWNY